MQTFILEPRPPQIEARQYLGEDPREQGWILGWCLGIMNPGVTITPDEEGSGFTLNSAPGDADPFSLHIVSGDWIIISGGWPEITNWGEINRRYRRLER